MARYAGRKGLVYGSISGSAVAIAFASLSAWSINRSTDKLETTAFLDANKVYVQGLPDLKGNFSGFWDDTETRIFSAAQSSDAIKMYLYPSQDALTKYAYGLAWLDASIDCSVNEAVKISGEFVAGGSWGFNF